MDIEFSLIEIFDYFVRVGVVTGIQLMTLIIPFLVLVILLHFLAKVIIKNAANIIGYDRYLGLFGRVGTTVHELGHLIFFVLFLHLIYKVKLFIRRPVDGKLGYVEPADIDHIEDFFTIGSFFIGIGPIIFGAIVIYFTGKLLLGTEAISTLEFPAIDERTFLSFNNLEAFGQGALHSLNLALSFFFSRQNLTDWKFYLFIYLAFSIASAMDLSKSDIRFMLAGLVTIIVVLYIINFFTLWSGSIFVDFVSYIVEASRSLYGVIVFVMMMSIVVALFVLLLYAGVSAIRMALKKKGD